MTSPDRPDRSAALGYSANRLDRLAEHREDTGRLAGLATDPAARAYVLAGDIPLLRGRPEGLQGRFTLAEADALGTVRERAFLGLDGAVPVFAVLIDARSPDSDQGGSDLVGLDLRSLAVQGLLPPSVLGELAQAKSLMHWHQRHRFCSNCGTATAVTAAGWRRECPSCGAHHFPRTDPVAIMLAVKGDRCVLGRQSRFPPGMYSCLAGFIEPGETLEDAVRRELFEEAGVATGPVRYLASQPWPFPASLMIGCLAEATDDRLTVDHQELEDARWFSREETRAMLEGRHPDGLLCPQPIAIANHLMRAWALEGEVP
jgi:NAD+ diphosphatase